MWLSPIRESSEAWFPWEPLTMLYPYKTRQKKVANAMTPYVDIIKRYSKSAKRPIQPVAEEYFEKQPEVIEQNVALLKNAIEFWRTATKVSDSIAPILVHYSWHCFNSFMIYSLFRWGPRHTKSHGIIIKLGDDLNDIKIQISGNGLFRRLVDTWTIIGVPLTFSRVWPVVEKEKVEFVSNDEYLPDQNNQFSLKQLLEFDSWEFQKTVYSKRKNQLIKGPYLRTSVSLFNRLVQAYLILFVASSIARYRPVLWQSILAGKGEEESAFALKSGKAAFDYILGPHGDDAFVPQVARIFDSMEKGTFVLTKDDGNPIK